MRHIFLLFIIGIAIGGLIAEQRTAPAKADPVDMLIKKSHGTMRKAGEVSQRADKQVAEGVSKMKESIQALESEKEQLVEQVKVMQEEIDSVGVDYRSMKSVADSLATENVRTMEMLRKASLEPKAAVRKANDQWCTGIAMYLWGRFVFFVLFEQ